MMIEVVSDGGEGPEWVRVLLLLSSVSAVTSLNVLEQEGRVEKYLFAVVALN